MSLGHSHSVTRSQLFTALYDELAGNRHAEHARGMADLLIRTSDDDRPLVGVDRDFRRAIYFDTAEQRLLAWKFDKHGVEDGAEVLSSAVCDPAEWLSANPASVGWVHPRYR